MKLLLAASAALLVVACKPATEPVAEAPAEAAVETPAPEMAPVSKVDPETMALAGDWLLTVAATPDKVCRITLNPENVGTDLLVTRVPTLDPACADAVPIASQITQWSGSGDGGIFLNSDNASTTVIELQPVDAAASHFSGTDVAGVKYDLRRPV